MMAAVAPAKVELPEVREEGEHLVYRGGAGWAIICMCIRHFSPLKTVWTVAKYEPMGTTIMAKVKASSLTMTSLRVDPW